MRLEIVEGQKKPKLFTKKRAECSATLSKMGKLSKMDTEREAYRRNKEELLRIWRDLS